VPAGPDGCPRQGSEHPPAGRSPECAIFAGDSEQFQAGANTPLNILLAPHVSRPPMPALYSPRVCQVSSASIPFRAPSPQHRRGKDESSSARASRDYGRIARAPCDHRLRSHGIQRPLRRQSHHSPMNVARRNRRTRRGVCHKLPSVCFVRPMRRDARIDLPRALEVPNSVTPGVSRARPLRGFFECSPWTRGCRAQGRSSVSGRSRSHGPRGVGGRPGTRAHGTASVHYDCGSGRRATPEPAGGVPNEMPGVMQALIAAAPPPSVL
jgi:hypothetical protein